MNSSCDQVTGACDTGCVAGWSGTFCNMREYIADFPILQFVSTVLFKIVHFSDKQITFATMPTQFLYRYVPIVSKQYIISYVMF